MVTDSLLPFVGKLRPQQVLSSSRCASGRPVSCRIAVVTTAARSVWVRGMVLTSKQGGGKAAGSTLPPSQAVSLSDREVVHDAHAVAALADFDDFVRVIVPQPFSGQAGEPFGFGHGCNSGQLQAG